VTGGGSKTNLFNQIALNPYALVTPVSTGSNSFQLIGAANAALVVSASAGWATVAYSTQAVSSAVSVRIPVTIESLTQQTNISSGLVAAVGSAANTNTIPESSKAAGELVGTNNAQTIYGSKLFTSSGTVIQGGSIVGAASIGGTVSNLSGGYWTNGIIHNVISTNLVNYGNAFQSPGSASGSQQFGFGALATAGNSLAEGSGAASSGINSSSIGNLSSASGDGAIAVGASANSFGVHGTAIGSGATAGSGDSATSLGFGAAASGNSSTAIGASASAAFDNSTAIGTGSTTTSSNQVMLGSPGSSAVVPNSLTVGTNLTVNGNAYIAGVTTNETHTGTNTYLTGSDIAFSRFALSTLGNGINQDIVAGTNVFVEVSGPSGAFSIEGIAGGRDGKLLIILNQTGFNMTIATEGGATGNDPTPANRVISMSGADRATTGNGVATLIYSGATSRWILIAFDP
jgi:trimeric autotransporter adhesin